MKLFTSGHGNPSEQEARTGTAEHPGEQERLSVFEDLDPESQGRERRSRLPEIVLGVALLVLIAAWGGWGWWQGQQKLSSYQAGQRAAAARDWEQAQVSFAAAGDYLDAGDRVAEAKRNIERRNSEYAQGQELAKQGDWIGALPALREVQQLQPNYRDNAALLQKAESVLYRGAMLGVVARRTKADPPGLYYRSASGWIWLNGSDARSAVQIRNVPSDSDVIMYDVPDGALAPALGAVRPTDQNGRMLMVAALSGEQLTFSPVLIDQDKYDRLIWGKNGGWGTREYRCDNFARSYQTPAGYPCSEIVYQPAGGGTVIPLALPDSNWRLVAGFEGSTALLARVSQTEGITATTEYYAAAPDGGNRRLVYSHEGLPSQATLSQDGRYALITTAATLSEWGANKVAVIVDLSGQREPRVLIDTSKLRDGWEMAVSASFLQGPRAHQVIMLYDTAGGTALTITDADKPGPPTEVLKTNRRPRYSMWAMSKSDGSLLAGFFESYAYDSASAFYIGPDNRVSPIKLSYSAGETLSVIFSRAGYLIYVLEPTGRANPTQPSYSVNAIDLAGALAARDDSHQLYAGPPEGSGDWPPLALGPDLMAYIDGGDLFVRTYDGRSSALLEPGIGQVFDLVLFRDLVVLQ